MDNTSSFMILKTAFSIIIDYLEIKRILANLYFEIGVLWSHFFICSMMLQISFFIFFYHQIYYFVILNLTNFCFIFLDIYWYLKFNFVIPKFFNFVDRIALTFSTFPSLFDIENLKIFDIQNLYQSLSCVLLIFFTTLHELALILSIFRIYQLNIVYKFSYPKQRQLKM